MSEPSDKPDVELSPTAVTIRARSEPAKRPEFNLGPPRRNSRQPQVYEVTTVTAVNMHTADTMRHISNNNVACVRLTEAGQTRRAFLDLLKDAVRIAGFFGILLMAALKLGPGMSASWAWTLGALFAVFGGTTVAEKVLASKRDDPKAVAPESPHSLEKPE